MFSFIAFLAPLLAALGGGGSAAATGGAAAAGGAAAGSAGAAAGGMATAGSAAGMGAAGAAAGAAGTMGAGAATAANVANGGKILNWLKTANQYGQEVNRLVGTVNNMGSLGGGSGGVARFSGGNGMMSPKLNQFNNPDSMNSQFGIKRVLPLMDVLRRSRNG